MTLQSVTPFAPSASEPSDRRVGVSGRLTTPGAAFSRTLSGLTPKSTLVTVQAGDTLSGLVQRHLSAQSGAPSLSADQLYRVALKVADDNGIPDAHLIFPDQRIDLSSVNTLALAESQQSEGASFPSELAPMSPRVNRAMRSMVDNDALLLTGPRQFLAKHAQAAQQAQAISGIPATFMMAQAGLETGWGRKEIMFEAGQTSHNLFGIKAGAQWKGPVAEVWTTEFVEGEPQRVKAKFRAYGSYEESFKDYARLISQNPRYANVMRNLGDPQAFANAIQQAGYATAPHYANALAGVIQTAQRVQATSANMQGAAPAMSPNAQPASTLSSTAMPSTAQLLSLRQGLNPGLNQSLDPRQHLNQGAMAYTAMNPLNALKP